MNITVVKSKSELIREELLKDSNRRNVEISNLLNVSKEAVSGIRARMKGEIEFWYSPPKKNCVNGHIITEVGRDDNGTCKQCKKNKNNHYNNLKKGNN